MRDLRPTLALAAALGAASAAADAARADDRALLRDAVGSPYVFILFDTSGSMHWTPRCSLESFSRPAGDPLKCDHLCPTGDCFAHRNGDDPASKLYQAKAALFEVLSTVENVHFGFATYNQDDLRAEDKHWLYQVSSTQPNGLVRLTDGTDYPVVGAFHSFGEEWTCDSGGSRVGCDDTYDFAHVDAEWEIERARRYPKLDRDGLSNTAIYIKDTGGRRYRVLFRSLASSSTPGQSLGQALLDVKVKVERCDSTYNNVDCGDYTQNSVIFDDEVRFERVGDFVAWDNGADPSEPNMGYFSQSQADLDADDTCAGWDPNSGDDDAYFGYGTRWPTDTSDPRGSLFHVGDVVPLDWLDNRKDEILQRLAPSTVSDPSGVPDFGVASYFADTRQPGQGYLRLKDERERPILAEGSTPIGSSVRDFRVWYAGCAQGKCKDDGWSDVAAVQDPDWGCRKKYLLVVTDGDNTCSGPDACSSTADLRAQEDVKTYVVAFGVENKPGNRLTCMAANGGTGEPIYPQSKQELVDALTKIFGEIKEETRTFASAAVPTVQSEVADKILLSSFTPINDTGLWDGHLDSYLKPLPLNADGTPDRAARCTPAKQSGCLLFDVGETLLSQSPAPADIVDDTAGSLKLGLDRLQRRVFYGLGAGASEAVPNRLRLLLPTTQVGELVDLWDAFAIAAPSLADTAQVAAATERVDDIIRRTLERKSATIVDVDGNETPIAYVLGDIFHSDPVVIDSPNNFGFFVQDLHADTPGAACDGSDLNRGYRCFADLHRWRRKMIAVGANDGQLHVFDGGYFQKGVKSKDPFDWKYVNERLTTPEGRQLYSGLELFSYIPRLVMPVLKKQVEGDRQIYSVDGSIRVDDVFIDPIHDGAPVAADREWRTVLVGGLREGGSIDGGGHLTEADGFVTGYYALDITQPDRVTEYPFERDTNLGLKVEETHYLPTETIVPSCIDVDTATGDHRARSGCATLHGDLRRFPEELWTFTDAIVDGGEDGGEVFALDEEDVDGDGTRDGNGQRDLGDTWSRPILTRVRVCRDRCDPADPDNDVEIRYVAIFGGGFDPFSKANPGRGRFIYMLDVETGRALYKRQVVGAVPATPAVVSDQFGIARAVYFGTTLGFVYKLDLRQPGRVSTVSFASDLFLPAPSPPRPIEVERVFAADWEPIPVFDTGGRQIFETITVVRVESLGGHGLAFGTGNREDLWDLDGVEGRFYFVVDDGFDRQMLLDGDLPLDEAFFRVIHPDELAFGDGADFILSPDADAAERSGWVLRLEVDERVIARAFVLKGIVIFSTFNPQKVAVDDDPGGDAVCARTGRSRVFALFADNADPILGERYVEKSGFLTPPEVDPDWNTNEPGSGGTQLEEDPFDDLEVIERLKKFYPKNCRFANYWLTITANRDDTKRVDFGRLPICSIEGRWKEF